jgi:hypothetical protein
MVIAYLSRQLYLNLYLYLSRSGTDAADNLPGSNRQKCSRYVPETARSCADTVAGVCVNAKSCLQERVSL